MSTQFIKTGQVPTRIDGNAGAAAEVLGEKICNAKNVVGNLRWLHKGNQLDATTPAATHRLVYVMEGDAVITLDDKDYKVGKGAGVYVGPEESAMLRPAADQTLKLFELIVPEIRE